MLDHRNYQSPAVSIRLLDSVNFPENFNSISNPPLVGIGRGGLLETQRDEYEASRGVDIRLEEVWGRDDQIKDEFRGDYETVVGFADNPFMRAEINKKGNGDDEPK